MSSEENDSDKKNVSIGSSYVDVIRHVITPQGDLADQRSTNQQSATQSSESFRRQKKSPSGGENSDSDSDWINPHIVEQVEPGDNWLLKLSKIFIWPILCLVWSLSEVADQQEVSKHLKKTVLGVSQLQLVINHERCMPCYEEIW